MRHAIAVALVGLLIGVALLTSESVTEPPGIVDSTALHNRDARPSVASGEVDEVSSRTLAGNERGGAVGAGTGVDSRVWWRKIIDDAPKDPRFPRLPMEEKALMHFSLSCWRPEKHKRWRLDPSDLEKDPVVNPEKRRFPPDVQMGLRSAIEPLAKSLRALEEGFELQLEEAYHRQIESGGYVEFAGRTGPSLNMDAAGKAMAQVEAIAGKPHVDQFQISISGGRPGSSVILFVTAASAPAVFETYREVQRVQDEARRVARQYLSSH